jgi:hypothetical protein
VKDLCASNASWWFELNGYSLQAMESPRRSSLEFQEQCRSEEVEAKRWMDRASRYLTEGRFESAIQLLQKTENVFPNCKNLPELMAVTQVCYAATWRACHCARPYTRKLPDWYHVLKVRQHLPDQYEIFCFLIPAIHCWCVDVKTYEVMRLG